MRLKLTHWGIATACLVLAACSQAPFDAIYQHDQCHRLTLIDELTGQSIIGAEDMLRLPNGDLLVSAYDRRGETAHGTPPQGGIYIVPKGVLNSEKISVKNLVGELNGGVRPHGIDAIELADGSLRVAFVNRAYDQSGKQRVSITHFDIRDGEAQLPQSFESLQENRFCRANDLTWARRPPVSVERQSDTDNLNTLSPDNQIEFSALVEHEGAGLLSGLLITFDRQSCGGFATFIENLTNRATGFLDLPLPERSARPHLSEDHPLLNLAFPNGIGVQFKDRSLGDENFLAIAETRANRLRYFPRTGRRDTVALPGSPDNITVGKPGLILAAVHPSLIRLALYRHSWPGFSRAPSRVVKVTGNQMLILFDDPTGIVFSAASVAVQAAGKLVLGSVGDTGLLVCGTRKDIGQLT